MSHFNCDKCGVIQVDSRHGYIAGCHHHPPEFPFRVLLEFDESGERSASGLYNDVDSAFYLKQGSKVSKSAVHPVRWFKEVLEGKE